MQLEISEFLPTQLGFCHPDWEAIGKVIESQFPEDRWNSAWEEAARIWIERLKEQLGGDYRVYETANFIILSEAPKRVMKDACRSFEESRTRILTNFGEVAVDDGYGKHVVMMFSSIDDYYGYIAYFYPEGEHPMSGAVCLEGEGYLHFAFPTIDYLDYKTVLVHELTHGCLVHLPIPLWLNEALAMRMEEVICSSNVFSLDREIYERHLAHWNQETIQQFWTGESWDIPGESSSLSYNLAQILWRKIESDLSASQAEILEFVGRSHWEDSGESVCQDLFGLSLGDLVADFLGDGAWSPVLIAEAQER